MLLKKFTTTYACECGVHCATCRADSPEGDEFRADKLTVFKEDITVCPHGKEMGTKDTSSRMPPKRIGPGDVIAWVINKIAMPLSIMTDHCPSCGGWKTKMNKAGWTIAGARVVWDWVKTVVLPFLRDRRSY